MFKTNNMFNLTYKHYLCLIKIDWNKIETNYQTCKLIIFIAQTLFSIVLFK